MGRLITLRSTTTSVGAVAYAAGDEVSNSATAGSVVRATFNLQTFRDELDGNPVHKQKVRGLILAAAIDLTPASGNVVTTASDFELLLFKTGDVPDAVGDNVTNPIAAATRALAVASFRFDDTGWTGPLGTVAAGASQFQKVMATIVQPLATNVPHAPHIGHPFEFGATDTITLSAVIRALAAWTPVNVVNTFGITLDLDME